MPLQYVRGVVLKNAVAIEVVPLRGAGPEDVAGQIEDDPREEFSHDRERPLGKLAELMSPVASDCGGSVHAEITILRQPDPAGRVIAVPGLEGRQPLGELVDIATDRGVLGRPQGAVEGRQEQRDQDRQDQDDDQQLHQRETARSAALAGPAADSGLSSSRSSVQVSSIVATGSE